MRMPQTNQTDQLFEKRVVPVVVKITATLGWGGGQVGGLVVARHAPVGRRRQARYPLEVGLEVGS